MEELTKNPVPGIAEEVEEWEEKQEDWQQTYNAGGPFKENVEKMAERIGAKRERKITELEEIPTSPEVAPKLEQAGYIEKVEKEAELAGPVMDDYTQQVLMSSPAPKNPVVTLPLTEDQIQMGLHQQVWASIRWLAEWCVRQIKMLHDKVRYRGK